MKKDRDEVLYSYKGQIQDDSASIEVLYNQHMMNIKSIDQERRDNRSDFNLKQKDVFIEHLKK